MKLIIATNNLHKINEIKSVIDSRFKLVALKDVGVNEEIPENEDTLEGNALAKARYVYSRVGLDVFADDTGLEVYSLGNRPGVYSARYAGGHKSSDDNINLLLKELNNRDDRKARFRTVISLIYSNVEYMFEGIVNGEIARERSGEEGFGYDPIFIPEGYNKTFAEMTLSEKNEISHRARAVNKLVHFLDSQIEQ